MNTEEISRNIHRKKRVSNEDLLQLQYECLVNQKENMVLKRKKLELQVQLLQQKVKSSPESSPAVYTMF